MELIDRYLQAVRFWLPKRQQEDIIAELSEDLHSQIEEKEIELARPLTDVETEEVLKHCGSPIVVASRYRPQTQLIGPALFPIYQFVLKLVLLWVLIPVFIAIIGPLTILPAANRWGAFFGTLSTLWTVLFMSAAVITLVFAFLERTTASLNLFEKWNVQSLPPAPKQSQPRSRTQSIFELVFGVIGLLWVLAVPHYPFLVLGPAAAFVRATPVWHQYYLWIVLLSAFGLAHQCVSLLRPQWAWFPPTAKLLSTILTMVLLRFLLAAAMHAPAGDWHPFVVAVSSAMRDAPHATRLVVVVNLVVLVSLASMWLGLCIAACIQTLEVLRRMRKLPSAPCRVFLPGLKLLF